jgi:hypothetical protein
MVAHHRCLGCLHKAQRATGVHRYTQALSVEQACRQMSVCHLTGMLAMTAGLLLWSRWLVQQSLHPCIQGVRVDLQALVYGGMTDWGIEQC